MNQRLHLQRIFSKLGICSRTEAHQYIKDGRVTVNGVLVTDPLMWVSLNNDEITCDGKLVVERTSVRVAPTVHRGTITVALHKPKGYITSTRSDTPSVPTVYECLPPKLRECWLFPVGRLDKESEGLLFLTNDGRFSNMLTDPAFHVKKRYAVLVDRLPTHEQIACLCRGIELDGSITKPCIITRTHGNWFTVELEEGRNRQIRRMLWSIKCKVKRLIRTDIGSITIGNLEPGCTRFLTHQEISALYDSFKNKHTAAGTPAAFDPPIS